MDRTSARGLARLAADFAEAGQLVADSKSNKPFEPAYFMFGHAIELALKAFLRSKGTGIDELKSIGHDLEKLLTVAQSRGLSAEIPLDQADIAVVQLVNPMYRTKGFEYITAGSGSWPPLQDVGSMASRITSFVAPLCGL